MPKWDFRCPACGVIEEHTFVSYVQVEHAFVSCRPCACPMDRLPAAPSFFLKGAGFYVNDYARKK